MSLLSVKNVGKAFRSYRSEWQRFGRWFGIPARPSEVHWVLRHINFDIQPGEAIGIIGQNGAGKSTLLKLIAGTLQPTEGQVQVNGRIAAILELGMGFNPDLTGRQNASHGLGLMGFSQSDIGQVMPELESFAEVGEYFDEPVRTYSSGMQMRVAFAVVTASHPDILIVDEALAVGDAAFQRKCFRRIEKFLDDGMTLLLVSHDVESIKKICSKALFLENGSQQVFGEVKSVCDKYEHDLFGYKEGLQGALEDKAKEDVEPLVDPDLLVVNELSYGDGRAIIENIWFENILGHCVNTINTGSRFVIKFQVDFKSTVRYPVFAFLIKTKEGISLYGTDTTQLGVPTEIYNAGDSIEAMFHLENHLTAGTYFINCGVLDDNGESSVFVHRRVDAAMIKVRQHINLDQVGLVNLSAMFSAIKIN